MKLWEWIAKLLTKEEITKPVPTYRLGDLTIRELEILKAALESQMRQQMEYEMPYSSLSDPHKELYKDTLNLYREVVDTLQQAIFDDWKFRRMP